MKIIVYLIALLLLASCNAEKTSEKGESVKNQVVKKVEKSNKEWKSILTDEQYRVAREAGTERPGGEEYQKWKEQGGGVYFCICCETELFTSKEKFDARCGWPAFYDASQHKNITTKEDYSSGTKRVEVTCTVCDAHLGHVFEGEGFNTPTNKRYCINGVVLKFVPFSSEKEESIKK